MKKIFTLIAFVALTAASAMAQSESAKMSFELSDGDVISGVTYKKQTLTWKGEVPAWGWSFGKHEQDFSAYNYFVVEFDEPASVGGTIYAEDLFDEALSATFEAGATSAVCSLNDPEGWILKEDFMKFGIRPASNEATLTLKAAYVCAEYTTGVSEVEQSAKAAAPAYNLSGQRVESSYKGIVIKGNKKIAQ